MNLFYSDSFLFLTLVLVVPKLKRLLNYPLLRSDECHARQAPQKISKTLHRARINSTQPVFLALLQKVLLCPGILLMK